MCVLLDDPRQLTPCSQAWRDLIVVCSSQTCASWANHVSKAPPLSACTHTPNDLPGGTASAGFSFGTWTSIARSTPTGTGSAARSTPAKDASATSRNSGTPRETGAADSGGAGRVVASGLGIGWLWETIFLAWGAVW
ncbi:hypothetical protein HOY80DRAFT_1012095 [Tuber brumale]|nr:hypothetical protein HOY80DRAFT_1012095 [Tuber brumale]